MSFGYRYVAVSGTVPGNEGVTDFIQELKDFMVTVGWSVTEDRTDQAGADNCKLVMESNGESGDYPTFYLVAHSGTDYTNFYMATAYDTGTHDVATSGVQTNLYTVAMSRLTTESQSDFQVWFSGDSEALAIVTDRLPVGETHDAVLVGRMNSFMSTADNPFPLYLISTTSATIVIEDNAGTLSRAVGGNPPRAYDAGNNTRVRAYTYLAANQPYTFGSADSIFLASPLIFSYAYNANQINYGIGGTVRNAWKGSGTTMGMLPGASSLLTASGTSGIQTYKAFPTSTPTTSSLIIRVS